MLQRQVSRLMKSEEVISIFNQKMKHTAGSLTNLLFLSVTTQGIKTQPFE